MAFLAVIILALPLLATGANSSNWTEQLTPRQRQEFHQRLSELRQKASREEFYASQDGAGELADRRQEYARKEADLVRSFQHMADASAEHRHSSSAEQPHPTGEEEKLRHKAHEREHDRANASASSPTAPVRSASASQSASQAPAARANASASEGDRPAAAAGNASVERADTADVVALAVADPSAASNTSAQRRSSAEEAGLQQDASEQQHDSTDRAVPEHSSSASASEQQQNWTGRAREAQPQPHPADHTSQQLRNSTEPHVASEPQANSTASTWEQLLSDAQRKELKQRLDRLRKENDVQMGFAREYGAAAVRSQQQEYERRVARVRAEFKALVAGSSSAVALPNIVSQDILIVAASFFGVMLAVAASRRRLGRAGLEAPLMAEA